MKERTKVQRKLEKEVEEYEKRVMELEDRIAEVEAQLSTPEGAQKTDLFTLHADLKTQLQQAEENWENAVSALEDFQSEA
jgi:ATP-binding cassette subfamily F protein 3